MPNSPWPHHPLLWEEELSSPTLLLSRGLRCDAAGAFCLGSTPSCCSGASLGSVLRIRYPRLLGGYTVRGVELGVLRCKACAQLAKLSPPAHLNFIYYWGLHLFLALHSRFISGSAWGTLWDVGAKPCLEHGHWCLSLASALALFLPLPAQSP